MQIGIVGGGLAGMFLAARLTFTGNKVWLWNYPLQGAASPVAAGLFNIFTGMRAAQTWQAELLLQALNQFFELPQCGELKQYLIKRPIYRPFQNIFEQNEWSIKNYADYAQIQTPNSFPLIHNPYGGLKINGCGRLRVQAFLAHLAHILIQDYNLNIINELFCYDNFDPIQKKYQLTNQKINFDAIVFCQGTFAAQNPFFPIQVVIPLKGEVLKARLPELPKDWILVKKVFVFESSTPQVYWVGSTYQRNFQELTPSLAGKTELLAHLAEMLPENLLENILDNIISHQSGLRPTTADRKPILGSSPNFSNVYIYNGLGTKGVLLAPYTSLLMANHILNNTPLPYELSYQRFLSSP